MIILIYHETQKPAANDYGLKHYGRDKFSVHVSENPNQEMLKIGIGKAIVYHSFIFAKKSATKS